MNDIVLVVALTRAVVPDLPGIAVMALVGLVALRFGVGWLLTSVLLRLLLRPQSPPRGRG